MVTLPKQHQPRQCATCGALFTPRPYAQARLDYCSQRCRLAVITVERSTRPAETEQFVFTPRAVQPVVRHEARCLLCGRVVLPSERVAWIAALRTFRCADCRGSLLFEEQDSPGAGSGGVEVVRTLRTAQPRPIRTGRVA